MCPAVPLVGWDVALTSEGTCLLEVSWGEGEGEGEGQGEGQG